MKTASLPLGRRVVTQLGFSLIEVCFAVAMLAIFSSGIMAVHSHVLGLLTTARDNIAASQALQQRIEQMRIANWLQITNATFVANQIRTITRPSTEGLSSVVETVTISAYPPRTGVTPITITRTGTAVQISSTNTALVNERMVRVDMRLDWKGVPNGRPRQRATMALIAKGGIAK